MSHLKRSIEARARKADRRAYLDYVRKSIWRKHGHRGNPPSFTQPKVEHGRMRIRVAGKTYTAGSAPASKMAHRAYQAARARMRARRKKARS